MFYMEHPVSYQSRFIPCKHLEEPYAQKEDVYAGSNPRDAQNPIQTPFLTDNPEQMVVHYRTRFRKGASEIVFVTGARILTE